ncbi:VWA domain-containing protein [Pseudoalteromonas sp. SSM20]|uniref:VWA domain-containing protein n=1 Tax=Pseudoalteromonas sp. SSM20 TaxID=3139394 RepID=UPI003BABC4FB
MVDLILAFHFLRPYYLLAIPLVFFLARIIRKHAYLKQQNDNVIASHLKHALTPQHTWHDKIKPIDFTMLLGILLSIACAGPTWRPLNNNVNNHAPLAIVLKLSQSMNANDFSPSRISYAKLKIKDLLALRSGAKHSLIVYASSTHRVLPLTSDNRVFDPFIDALSSELMPNNQSISNDDLATAVKLAREEVTPLGGSILVLADSISETELTTLNNLKTSFIWWQFATEKGGVVTDETGNLLINTRGQPLIHKPNNFNIDYIDYIDFINTVSVSINNKDVVSINRLADQNYAQFQHSNATEYEDMAWHVSLIILLLVLLWFRKGWTSVLSNQKQTITNLPLVFIAIGLISFAPQSIANPLDWFFTKDQQGIIAFKQHNYEKAAQLFTDPKWQANAYYENGNYLKAAELYATLGTTEGFYNRATALLKGHQYLLAIQAFEQVLATSPNHHDAKHNLAIAKQAYQLVIAQAGNEDLEQNIAIDNEPTKLAKPSEGEFVEYQVSDTLSQDAKEQWMRSVNTDMAEFLATKFANDLNKPQGSK